MATYVALVKAAGTLTVTGNFSANDTVITNSEIYKFVASPAAAGDVDIGSDAEGSLDNLVLAMNGTGTPGATTYYTGTIPTYGCIATNTATVLTLTARFPGTWGNSVHFEEGTDGGSTFSITQVMASGAGDISGAAGFFPTFLAGNQINAEVLAGLKQFTEAAD